jgi:hypothetical protein
MPKSQPAWRKHSHVKVSKHVSSRKHVLNGGSAVDLSTLLREWDAGKKETRIKILRALVVRNQQKTGAELEMEYGNGASLFLTRITAWLRLTYLLGVEVALQLQAIHIFLSAASGHRFLTEFLEVGGVLTVLEILNLRQLFEEDVVEALQILHTVATTGRPYKELICEMAGVDAILHCLRKSRTETQCEACRLLLITLGRGNPTYAPMLSTALVGGLSCSSNPKAQRISAQTLRTLVDERATGVSVELSWSTPALGMLRTRDLQTQYEGFELIKLYYARAQAQAAGVAAGGQKDGAATDGQAPQQMGPPLLAGLAYLLRHPIPEHRAVEELEAGPEPVGPGRAIPVGMKEVQEQIKRECLLSDEEGEGEDDDDLGSESAFDDNVPDEGEFADTWRSPVESAMAPMYCQQLGVARLLTMLQATSGGAATEAFAREYGGVGALLVCIAQSPSHETVKQAATALQAILKQLPEYLPAVAIALGEECAGMLAAPGQLADKMAEDRVMASALVDAVASQTALCPARGVDPESDTLWLGLPPMPTVPDLHDDGDMEDQAELRDVLAQAEMEIGSQ